MRMKLLSLAIGLACGVFLAVPPARALEAPAGPVVVTVVGFVVL